jgi:hypothetical protein
MKRFLVVRLKTRRTPQEGAKELSDVECDQIVPERLVPVLLK